MRILALLLTLLFTFPSMANWELINHNSQFHFISTKKNNVMEIHQFTQLRGTISNKGKISFEVDLMSAETNIPVRNERLQKFLFQTDIFPQAIFTAQMNMASINTLNIGEMKQITLIGTINLHGIQQPIKTQVNVIKLKENAIQVNSVKPIIIQAKDFKLAEGIEKLRSLAKLPSISNAVPVTFSFNFAQ